MAVRSINAKEYVCNGCGRTTLTRVDTPPPDGIFGTVDQQKDGVKTEGGQFYACRRSCVGKAALAVVDAKDFGQPEQVPKESGSVADFVDSEGVLHHWDPDTAAWYHPGNEEQCADPTCSDEPKETRG